MLLSRKFKDIFNRWLNILMEEGLKKEEAEDILIWIFSDNRFMTDITDIDIAREVLNDVNLENFRIDNTIKEKMIEALKEIIGTKCPKCGALISEDVKFCPNCGLPVGSSELSSTEQIPALQSPVVPVSAAIRGQIEQHLSLEDEIIHETFEELREEIEDLLDERPELEGQIKAFAKTVIEKYKSIRR